MDKFDEEFKKMEEDIKTKGVGIFDQIEKRRVDPHALMFSWDSEIKMKLKSEVHIKNNLAIIQQAFKEKFNNDNPYNLELFKKDPAAFVERMIRAVEICTLNYVLSVEKGNLNLNKRNNLIMGKKRMVWEE